MRAKQREVESKQRLLWTCDSCLSRASRGVLWVDVDGMDGPTVAEWKSSCDVCPRPRNALTVGLWQVETWRGYCRTLEALTACDWFDKTDGLGWVRKRRATEVVYL